jgi:GDP-4-dehydro-6-deoxy-D-mannose reductase
VVRALVSGATGFAGPYLIRHLLESGYEVFGGVHGTHTFSLPEECHPLPLDVTDRMSLEAVVAQARPDEIYHLAGITRPATGAIDEFYRVNLEGALNLLETVRDRAPGAAVLLVGSAYAYGRVDRPISETQPLRPVNHYGVSKAAADMLGYAYFLEGLRVVRARPFNHSGPGQSPDFLLPTLVKQFAEIKAGKREPTVSLGNLDSVRDLSDVRDVVRGYHLAAREGRSGDVYNLGSGRGTSVRRLFELVSAEAGVEAKLVTEPARVRAADIPVLEADASKAREELGWEPEITLERTIRDMLDDAIRKIPSG